jgi:hypothetical protein
MRIFKAMLSECGINPPFMAVDEENPSTLIRAK